MNATTKKIMDLFDDDVVLEEAEKRTATDIVEYLKIAVPTMIEEHEKANPDTQFSYDVFYPEIHTLSLIYAYGILNRCIDPNRKNTKQTENKISNNGFSPYATKARKELARDIKALENMNKWNERVNRLYKNRKDVIKIRPSSKTFTSIDPEYQSALIDNKALDTLGDGMEYYLEAYAIILQYVQETKGNLEEEVTRVRKSMSGKVIITTNDEIVIPDEEVKQPATKAIVGSLSNMVDSDRAVRYDPTSKYLYESLTDKNDNRYYYRFARYADLGSYTSHGMYTASDALETQLKINAIKKVLSPTEKIVFDYVMRKASLEAIAKKLGIKKPTVQTHLNRIRKKAENLGIFDEE